MADIFISHTEEDGNLAIRIAAAVEHEGYIVWYYERDSVPGPSYLIQVGREIEASQAILLLASPSSLLSQHVTNEVIRAYEHGKYFIPLLLGITHGEIQEKQPIWRQCLGSSTSIPIDNVPLSAVTSKVLAGLAKLGVDGSSPDPDAPGYSHARHEPKMDALGAVVSGPDWGQSSVRFGDGAVSFRTERFEPTSQRTESRISLGSPPTSSESSRPTEVELAFQLINQTSHSFTIAAIRVLYFGKVVVLEDCPAFPEQVHALYHAKASASCSPPSRTDLGALAFTFGGDTDVAAAETSSLLKPLDVEILRPHSLRSFLIKLRCMETNDHIVMLRSQLIQVVESVMHRSDQAWSVVSVPALLSIGEKIALEDLDRGNPEPVSVAHIFGLSATLVADTGPKLTLCSDSTYSLYPRLDAPELRSVGVVDERSALRLEKWLCQTPSQLVQYLTNWSIKAYKETLAFHIAARDDAIREGLNPNEVSPFCYCGDRESPLRLTSAAQRASSSEERVTAGPRLISPFDVMKLPPSSPVPRSNLVQFLASTLTRWPESGTQMWEALRFLEVTDDEVLKNKLAYVREQLTAVALQVRGGRSPQNNGMQPTA